ncbi:MAG TPA: SNF2-related protein [Candidatus Binatia bacterium]
MSDLAPLQDWLPDLDADRVERMLGVHRAPSIGRRTTAHLVGDPVALRNQLVLGKIRTNGSVESVSVGVAHNGELAALCSCQGLGQEPPCEHVAGLLDEMAASPALRERLLRESSAEETQAAAPAAPDLPRALSIARRHGIDLEAARAAVPRRTSLLDTTFAAWRRRGALRPLGAASFLIAVERGDEDLEAPARLRVRVQPQGERQPFGPDDLEGRRLPAHEWRLFEPLRRAPEGGRDFVAEGEDAALFLDRIAEAGLTLHDFDGNETLTLLAQPVRPALRLRPATDEDVRANELLQMRADEVAEEQLKVRRAWLEYNTGGRPIDEPAFRALLGLPSAEAAASRFERGFVLEAVWRPTRPGGAIADEGAPVPFTETVLLRGATGWVFFPEARCFARVAHDVGPIALARLAAHPQVLVEPADVARVPALLHEHFQSEGVALPSRDELGLPPLPVPRIVLRVTGAVFAVEATLEAHYGERVIVLTPASCATIEDPERNAELERAAVDVVSATVLELARRPRRRRASVTPPDTETWRAQGDEAVFFWTHDLPRLVAETSAGGPLTEVVVPPALRNVTARPPLQATLTADAARPGSIVVALRYAADGIPADVEEIRQALAAKRRWVRLTDGSVAELSQKVAALVAATQDTLGNSLSAEVPRHLLGEVAAWSELAENVELDELLSSWTRRLRELASSPTAEPIPGLQGDLRSYQKVGVAWLQLLSELGTGGILADDMGLGKTIQTLALLAWRRARDGSMPSLVVAPTSVAPNWIREAERFVPGLRTVLLHGLGRHARYEDVPNVDLVVTTYALLRRDVERLRDIRFRYVILDEAQQIKNHAAATTAAAKSLAAEARLALTGTPIENRLLELWSILDFVNPGMLGSWRSFSRRYERPVMASLGELAGPAGDEDEDAEAVAAQIALEQEAAAAEAAALRARIRPFVLRRTKADVESDLPPKIETDVVVEMTPAQHRAYAALVTATREDLSRRIARDGFEKSRMVVLTALLRLRQMACDPRLVDPRYRPQDSAKLEAFRELTSEVIASGRRALVFSQFVELLTLLRQDLNERGIEYAYLDGRTRDRAAVLNSFTEGTMPLFLLSLRAGGTGINLTAADVVIHLDPWWNPAVEEQATDRAHRIGQRKTVSVYRIIAAGTIEEAILRLKRQKRALASSVIDDDRGWIEQLGESEVAELLGLS